MKKAYNDYSLVEKVEKEETTVNGFYIASKGENSNISKVKVVNSEYFDNDTILYVTASNLINIDTNCYAIDKKHIIAFEK